jgi:two-component system response regulator MtrA
MNTRILLVEDDVRLGEQVVARLVDAGFTPLWLRDGSDALVEDPSSYALIVLDLMLPGAHGLDILKRYRVSSETPVIVLSARNETSTKVRALELGADDYVTKPFWPEELLARIQARLRRPTLTAGGVYENGGLRVDFAARRAEASERIVDLTRVEFDILAALLRRPGAAVSRPWLAANVLDPDREGTARTLDVHVSRLRKKLGSVGARIATVWGIGYRFDPGGGAELNG